MQLGEEEMSRVERTGEEESRKELFTKARMRHRRPRRRESWRWRWWTRNLGWEGVGTGGGTGFGCRQSFHRHGIVD